VYAIGAGTPSVSVDGEKDWRILNTAKRVAFDIMPNEVGRKDFSPFNGWGVEVVVIQPRDDLHDAFTIDPGRIRINMAYGFMRADDVMQARSKKPAKPLELAETYSVDRHTYEIVELRKSIWEYEFAVNGKKYVAVKDLPPTPSAVVAAPVPNGALAKLRQMKMQLKALVEKRLAAGGECPAGYDKWWLDWEAHNWAPAEPLWKTLLIAVTPAKVGLNKPVTFTVSAWAQAAPVTDADVRVDGKAIGKTGKAITYTFVPTTSTKIDPVTKQKEPPEMPVVTVYKQGYPVATVPILFA
jgi:hypothetical protein